MKHKKGSLTRDVLINLSSDMLIQQLTVPYRDKLFYVNDAFEYSTSSRTKMFRNEIPTWFVRSKEIISCLKTVERQEKISTLPILCDEYS